MRKFALVFLFSVGCSNLDSVSLDSLSQVQNVGSISDVKPKIGNIDVAQAASAAKDLGEAVMLSEEEVAKMALGYAKHSDQNNKIAPPSSSYSKRLAKIIAKHSNEDGMNLNYKVYLSKEVNAFALADGSVRVYSGLMDLMNDEEVLAVIGHEVGHVKLGHSADRIRLANAASGVRKAVGSSNSVVGVVANQDFLGGTIEKVINSQFSQTQETESDEYAVSFLRKNGYNLNAAITAFNKLAEMDGESSFVDSLLSSHPASEDRAKHLAEIIGADAKVEVVASRAEPNKEKAESLASNDKQQSSANMGVGTEEENVKAGYAKQASVKAKNTTIASGWYVQVSAKTEPASAKLLEMELEKYGFNAQQQNAVVNGVKYHRVLVGPFDKKAEALLTKQKVVESSITNEEPFIKILK